MRNVSTAAPKSEVNQVSERRLLAQTFGADLERTSLVDGASVDTAASRLFTRHRLPGNRRLFHKRVSANDQITAATISFSSVSAIANSLRL